MSQGRTYTKRDVATRLAQKMGATLHAAEQWTDEVFNVLSGILETDEPALRIEIRNFGVIEIKPTKPKPKARNPRTGEIILVPAHRKTHFRPSKHLREILKRPLATQVRHDPPENLKA